MEPRSCRLGTAYAQNTHDEITVKRTHKKSRTTRVLQIASVRLFRLISCKILQGWKQNGDGGTASGLFLCQFGYQPPRQ